MTYSQKSKVSTNKPNPLHFSQWHKVPKRKGLSSNKVHLIGIKSFSKRHGRQWELKQFLGKKNKAIRSKIQGEGDPQLLPQIRISIVKDNECIEILFPVVYCKDI